MRIPFPERVPIDKVTAFAVVLFMIQIVEGTSLAFSAGCVAFIMLAAIAFNTGGGLTRVSGAYVFFYSVFVVLIGLCYKAYLGEAADSNLLDPRGTISMYVVGMAAMLAAVDISRRISRKAAIYRNVLKDADMYRAAVGCILFGIGGPFLVSLLGASGMKLNSALAQLNDLVPMAIIIGTMSEIRVSGGTRSTNVPVLFAAGYFFFFYGMLGFSKAGLLTPFYCWLLPICAMRFRLTALQASACLLWVFIVFHYLVPYSQYGRLFIPETPTTSARMDVALRLLEHPEDTRNHYEENEKQFGGGFYNQPQGFWDRLQFIAVDDGMVNLTNQGHVFGLSPIFLSFENAVPHVIWPNKPSFNFGNAYAHELGGLPDDDMTTGISFSPLAEAYHLAKWEGLLIIVPLVLGLMFVVLDSLFGDLRTTPWGILILSFLSHYAPETGITGAIYLVTFGTAIFSFCAFFAAWVAPPLATMVLGRRRWRATPLPSFRASIAEPAAN